MRKEAISVYLLILIVAGSLLTNCEPISLQQTIDDMVFGWSRAVTLTSPEDGVEIAEKTPVLDWEAAGGATGYEVQISNIENFDGIESIEIKDGVTQYEIPDALTISDLRYWRVRAVNKGDTSDVWSDIRSFEIVPSKTPEFVTSMDIGTQSWGIRAFGNYLYSSAGSSGFKIFDLSVPAAPVLTDTYAITDGVWDISLAGDYAYITEMGGDNPQMVYLFDVSNPANIVLKGSYSNNDQLYGLLCVGPAIYVGYTAGYLRFDNIAPSLDSDPLKVTDPGNRVNSFALYGAYLVFTIDNVGIRILQLNGDTLVGSAAVKETIDFDNSLVTVYDHYAYVTSMNYNYIEIFDLEDVNNPESVGTYALPIGGLNISVKGHFAFVSTMNGAVQILDLSDPAAPVPWAEIPGETTQAGLTTISGNYMYGTNYTEGTLSVVDLVPEH